MKLFNNSNGRAYAVIQYNTVDKVAILKPLKPIFEDAPYMVVKGFDVDATSWGAGIYDLTIEEASREFNKCSSFR